jgi:hypothetical protein
MDLFDVVKGPCAEGPKGSLPTKGLVKENDIDGIGWPHANSYGVSKIPIA